MARDPFHPQSWINLRIRLWLVMLVVLLPGLGYSLTSSVLEHQRARAKAQADLVLLARLAASEEQQSIQDMRGQLALLAALAGAQAALQADATQICNGLLRAGTAFDLDSVTFAVWNPAGDLACASPSSAQPVTAAPEAWFRETVASRGFSIGEFKLNGSHAGSAITFGYPLLGSNDQLLGVVSSSLDLGQLAPAALANLPADGVVTVFDISGTVLARSSAAVNWVGKNLPDSTGLGSALSNGSNTMERPDVDGVWRLTAFAPIIGPGGSLVYLSIGRPTLAVFGSVDTALAVGLGITAVLTLIAILLATWWGQQSLVRPVQRLRSTTDRLARGDLTARAQPEAVGSEVDGLVSAVNVIAGQLAQTNSQREHDQGRLRDLDGQLRLSHARATQLETVAAGLSKAGTPADVLEVILRQGASPIGAVSATLLLLSDDGHWLKHAAHSGQPDPIDRLFKQFPVSSPLPAADVVRTGEAMWIDSAAAYRARYPQLIEVINSMDYEAAVAVPLRVGGVLIGVLALSFPGELSASGENATYIASLASLCALGLERARLYAERQALRPA